MGYLGHQGLNLTEVEYNPRTRTRHDQMIMIPGGAGDGSPLSCPGWLLGLTPIGKLPVINILIVAEQSVSGSGAMNGK